MTITEKQKTFLTNLIDEREPNEYLINLRENIDTLTVSAASTFIDVVKALPKKKKKKAVATKAPAPEGMHLYSNSIYKVQQSPSTGRSYAKKLVSDDADGYFFEYAPGAAQHLSEETKMSIEEAKKYGALYGTCIVCGRTLTNESSISAGIGQICAKNYR